MARRSSHQRRKQAAIVRKRAEGEYWEARRRQAEAEEQQRRQAAAVTGKLYTSRLIELNKQLREARAKEVAAQNAIREEMAKTQRAREIAAFEASLQRAEKQATARGATPAQIVEMKEAARRGYPISEWMDTGTAEYQRRRMMAYELYLKAGDKLRDAASSGNCDGLMKNWMKYKHTRGRGDYFLGVPRDTTGKYARDLGVVTRQLDVMSSRVGSMVERACSLSRIGITPKERSEGPQKAATSRKPKALTTTFDVED